ncbi:ATP-binding cassette domain-containing protein [Methanothrix sp.]|uniref:ATP-binding cassette domain-containing protein n=1 Tax=Methanothrix sp. TaxID=90426 RepID=UPI003C727781
MDRELMDRELMDRELMDRELMDRGLMDRGLMDRGLMDRELANGIEREARQAKAVDDAAISARGLTKRFGETTAVDNIDLLIRKGELFGLLGANGAGKSTIIKMLTTMLTPTSGEAKVWGYDIVRERSQVRSSIGVVFQDPALDGMLTGRENLDFHGRMYGMDSALRKARIADVLELVDLKDKADTQMQDYSGGMKRRLEIARGLMHRPHVLFLDEPTIGLDAQTRRYIWEYIRRMNREMGVTIILTTHYMEEADFLCDRVAIMDRGRIVALDRPENLKDAIGSDTITLVTDSDKDALISSFQSFSWIKSISSDNGSIKLRVDHAQSRVAEIVLEASRNNAVISSVGLHKPTLEDVFIKYTGKRMEESGSRNKRAEMAPPRGGR